jgi:hypothetical protein
MRTRLQMEAQIREILARFRDGDRGHEDLFVELKRELPSDALRAARRIAALCNSAHGAEALWIVGVEEKTGQAHPAAQQNIDIGRWWPQIQRCFDDVTPDVRHVIVHIDDGYPVIGLFFTTDQAPYVIKLPDGLTQKEIPWREATNTRSATRREIVRMLAPAVDTPVIDHIQTSLSYKRFVADSHVRDSITARLRLDMQLFVDATRQVAFPMHRQELSIQLGDSNFDLDSRLHFEFSRVRLDDFVKVSDDVLVVMLPSMIYIEGVASFREPFVALEDLVRRCAEASFSVELGLSGVDRTCVIRGVAHRHMGSDVVLDRPPLPETWIPNGWSCTDALTVNVRPGNIHPT